jgi:hypothetical protein
MYNVVKMAFSKLMPNATLAFKGKWSSGSKNSKERITAMLYTNLTGIDKLLLLVTGEHRSLHDSSA